MYQPRSAVRRLAGELNAREVRLIESGAGVVDPGQTEYLESARIIESEFGPRVAVAYPVNPSLW
jgi:hypothetical protein